MQPIFKEMIQMWSDLGYPLPIQEGRFWLHNHFICGFKSDGELHKLWKYKVFDDLSIKITPYSFIPESFEQFESWSETIERLDSELLVMEDKALDIIDKAVTKYFKHKKYVFISTGKDSMVVLHLVKRRVQKAKIFFNNTSLDVADTYRMVKKHKNWNIINPQRGFYQLVKANSFIPTRFSRECCGLFKEQEAMKHFNNKDKICFFMGIRNDESLERADRKDFDRNPAWRNRKWISCLPIREWSELHVWLYILKYNLEINSKYRKGYKRVGCGIACPYYTKYTWVLDKYWYKYLFERWHKILEQDFLTHSRWNRLNCTLDEYIMSAWNGGLYRSEPNDEVVQEFMNYKGITDKSIAVQYFNKRCKECDKRINSNEVIGMNLKYFGRDAKTLLCRGCFQNIMEMTDEQWDEAIEGFKAQGCQLF